MMKKKRNYFAFSKETLLDQLGKEHLLHALDKMLKIRAFEMRAEGSYLAGEIGGFFHSYMGQEAIQTAAVDVLGKAQWYITSYRCHALPILLGEPPKELMAELLGKATGNALGRGGSMHLYSERFLGGFGIVGGQIPTATGAAFALKYQNEKDKVAICFLGDGAVAQGTFHESLNIAALLSLPCIYVIENNQWGMGTHIDKAVSVNRLAEDKAESYGIKGYSVDGADYLAMYSCMDHVFKEVKESGRPVLVEAVTERFRGHSISDPGLYRTKEELKDLMQDKDPLKQLKTLLEERGWITDEQYKQRERSAREEMVEALEFARKSPWPAIETLEEDVFAK
jgi:pyruvate dehydrogenase E1 component alpha subunit